MKSPSEGKACEKSRKERKESRESEEERLSSAGREQGRARRSKDRLRG
jgi:hypothetical protein